MVAMGSLKAGIAVPRGDVAATIAAIVAADRAGIATAWSTSGGLSPDPLTVFAAAAGQTERVKLGTSIVPIYPRDPVALASQALVLAALAPGRLRLGIGTSHRASIEGIHGIPMGKPLSHLREYLIALRGMLWDGNVDLDGEFYRIHAALPQGMTPPKIPVPIAALRENAYRLAGELADGAISWVTPVPFLVNRALPALRLGAAGASRPTPPLIGHVPVAVSTDRAAVLAAGRKQLGFYARAPFYQRMFADAGYQVGEDGTDTDVMIEDIVVSGTPDAIRQRLEAIQAKGIDELLISQIVVSDEASERATLLKVLGE